jgi:hypothetical protein
LFTNAAINIKERQPTLAYRMDVVDVGYDPDGTLITAPVIRWEGEVDITAQEALDATRTTKSSRSSVRDFLNVILANGPALASLIIERGAERGFSLHQLQRARKIEPAIRSFRRPGEGKHSSWWWVHAHELPPDAEEEEE